MFQALGISCTFVQDIIRSRQPPQRFGSVADLAQAPLTLAVRLPEEPAAPTGVFHFSNAGAVTCTGFARAIFAQSEPRGGPEAKVTPITTADYPAPARRPAIRC